MCNAPLPVSLGTSTQVVRNIAMWTFRTQEALDCPEVDYRERSLWNPLVEPLLDLATETESHELLVEVSGNVLHYTTFFFTPQVGDAAKQVSNGRWVDRIEVGSSKGRGYTSAI